MENINISVQVHESVAEQVRDILSTTPTIHHIDGRTVAVFGNDTYSFEIADFLLKSTPEERERLLIQAKIKRLNIELRELENKLITL